MANSCRQAYTLAKVLKRVAMSKDITILTSANHTSTVKAFSGPDLKVQPFAIGEDFNVIKEPVSDLSSLAELLHRLESEPAQTIIKGSSVVSSQVDLDRIKQPQINRTAREPRLHFIIRAGSFKPKP